MSKSLAGDVGCYRNRIASISPLVFLSTLLIPSPSFIYLFRLAAQTAASYATQHPDYSILAARISVSNLHKMTISKFLELCEAFFHYSAPLVSEEVYNISKAHKDVLDGAIVHARDFDNDYFGRRTARVIFKCSIGS